MKIALAQIDTTVGDLAGNVERHLDAARAAAEKGAQLVVFPELSIPGYPGWDLLEHQPFIRANVRALEDLARRAPPVDLLVGFAEPNRSASGKRVKNSVALLSGGKLALTRAKSLLPTYDVFDESRYFEPARSNPPFDWKGRRVGLSICEDIWNEQGFWPRRLYARDPIETQLAAGAGLLINLSSSPYHRGKLAVRRRMLQSQARRAKAPVLYCNLVGGNDELLFDGNSLAVGPDGAVWARGRAFEEHLVVVDLDAPHPRLRDEAKEDDAQEVRRALVLGLRDYARKSGFSKALVGLSGGIDSALVCALAAEALGPENVLGVTMPSVYSSEGSVSDSKALASNLGVRLVKAPITPMFEAFKDAAAKALGAKLSDLTEQNLQPRVRGTLLMAMSNQLGALLLSTGNKSELSTGYCTLYGDLTGGLAVLADVPKTLVYEIARRINKDRPVIPEASLTKPPSAELKPGQRDQDDLPPYELLDRIVQGYIEEGKDLQELAAEGIDRDVAASVLKRVDRAEYKRRQAPPGLKITPKAFGIGRKMPLARGDFRKLPAWVLVLALAALGARAARAETAVGGPQPGWSVLEPPRIGNAGPDILHASELLQLPNKEEIATPLTVPNPPPPPEESLLSRLVRRLTIPLERGPLFILPLVDRYKDLGFTYGLMPIEAVRGKGDQVNQVYAPSFLWNQYLKSTLTWRGYYFPDSERLIVTRAAWSQESDREVFLRYFDPRFQNTKFRLNAEFHWLVTGRPSFYGFGPDSPESAQANYAYHQVGEEVSLDVPIWDAFFLDITHSFYQKEATDGPINTVSQVSQAFPAQFAIANQWADYLYHQAAIIYDSTDHAALPTRGFYANVSAGTSQSALASSYTYQQYGAEVKKYFNMKDGAYITALHAQLQQQTGDTLPFYQQMMVGESEGLRVVGDDRFTDRGRAIFSLEERFRVSQARFLKFVSEMELTPFVDSGTVFHDPSGFKLDHLHWAYGSAFRLVLRPQVVGTVDLALGQEGPNVIVHVGYPF